MSINVSNLSIDIELLYEDFVLVLSYICWYFSTERSFFLTGIQFMYEFGKPGFTHVV